MAVLEMYISSLERMKPLDETSNQVCRVLN
jgi:hypothetical protein